MIKMAESRKEDCSPCEFRYELFGFGWAELYMRIKTSLELNCQRFFDSSLRL